MWHDVLVSDDVDPVAPESDERRFAENMRRYREAKGWSQGELARRVREAGLENFHQTTISRIEKGERPIRLGEARVIAQVLKKSLTRLLLKGEEALLADDLVSAHKAVAGAWFEIQEQTNQLITLKQDRLQTEINKARRAGVKPSRTAPAGSLENLLWSAQEAMKFEPERAVEIIRKKHDIATAAVKYAQEHADEYAAEGTADDRFTSGEWVRHRDFGIGQIVSDAPNEEGILVPVVRFAAPPDSQPVTVQLHPSRWELLERVHDSDVSQEIKDKLAGSPDVES